jgi:hypothetical protein
MILGAGYLPFVFASIRPDAAAGVMEIVAT